MEIRRKPCSEADGMLNSNCFFFDIFKDNYFTPFRLLTLLGVNNIRATSVLNKNSLLKCTGDKHLQKSKRGYFEQRTSSKKTV